MIGARKEDYVKPNYWNGNSRAIVTWGYTFNSTGSISGYAQYGYSTYDL